MGKETKIGLTVIAVLLVTFGVVLYQRLTRDSERTVTISAETPPANSLPRKKLKLTGDSHPTEPGTIVAGSQSQPTDDSFAGSEDQPTGSDSPLAPQTALMPPVDDRYAGRLQGQAADLPDDEPQPTTDQEQPLQEGTEASTGDEERSEPEGNPETAALKTTGDAQLTPTPAAPNEFVPAAAGENPLRRMPPTGAPGQSNANPNGAVDSPEPTALNKGGGDAGLINKTSATQAASSEPELAPPEAEKPRSTAFEQTSAGGPSEPLRVAQAPSGVSAPQADDVQFGPSNYRLTAGQSFQEPQNHTPPANGQYTIGPNDNYWVISEKVYGTGGYFKAIQQHNRARYPHADKLQVGDTLAVPSVAVLQQNYPSMCPKPRGRPGARPTALTASTHAPAGSRTYIVAEGDTLFDIARYELGKAARWAEIYDLNREAIGEDFDFIAPGTHLVLPGQREQEDSVTRQPGPELQR